MILITNIIKEINSGCTAIEANTLYTQHVIDCNVVDLRVRKIEVIKRYYLHKMEQDTVYAGLSFQADQSSRDSVITPRSLKALQAQMEGNTAWSAIIVSNTKDADGLDIPKSFTSAEMLEFADAVTFDVENYYFQQKTHCNNVEQLATDQEVLDYDFS